MNTIHKVFLSSAFAIALISPAVAEETHHRGCRDDVSVELGKMGVVNEEALKKHIDKVERQMQRVRHARGSHVSQKRELKQHLAQMQRAMQALHSQMYAGGCKAAIDSASAETRVEMMEQRMGMMQQVMEQMLEHLAEQAQ